MNDDSGVSPAESEHRVSEAGQIGWHSPGRSKRSSAMDGRRPRKFRTVMHSALLITFERGRKFNIRIVESYSLTSVNPSQRTAMRSEHGA